MSRYRHATPREGGVWPLILYLGTRLGEWFTSCPGRGLVPGMDTRYPLDRRLGGPQSWSGHRGYRKYPLPLLGIKPRSPSL
jgi:hypothetical protein